LNITTETATVYRGGGRRWFSLKAACRAEAKEKLRKNCDCDTFDAGCYGEGHITCALHKPERYPKIVRRLTRIYMAAYRAAN